MSISLSEKLKIPIRSEYLLILYPLNFVFGYWQFNFLITFLIFIHLIKDKILLENLNIIFPYLLLWIINFLWGLYSLSKAFKLTGGGEDYFIVLYIVPFFIFNFIFNIKTDFRFFEKLFNVIIISGLILSFVSFYNLAVTGFDFKQRIFSSWPDLNILAGYYLIVFMILVSFVMNTVVLKKRIFYFISLFIILFAIFLTQTRGIWLAIIFALVVYLFNKPKLIIPLSILFVVLLFFFADIILTRVMTIRYFSSDLSSLGRLQAWIATLVLLKNNFLTGYGFNSFMYLRDYAYAFYLVPVIHSHNTYLTNLLEIGLIGTVLYYYFFIKSIFMTSPFFKKDKINEYRVFTEGIFLSLVGFLVAFLFEPYFRIFSSTAAIWLLISVSFKINSLVRET